MTRVLLDGRNITDTPAGVARYALALIPRMIELRPDWDWCVLRHASNRTPIDGAREVFSDVSIDGWTNFLRGDRVYAMATERLGTPDLIHSLFHLLPRRVDPTFPVVVTAHDFIWIDHPEISQSTSVGALVTSLFSRRAIPHALRRAQRVIAVSEATARRATEWIGRDEIRVIPHGVAPRYFEPPPTPDVIVEFLRGEEGRGRYVVAVGNAKRYKNLATLMRAFAELDDDPSLRLVLVGDCDALTPLAEELGIDERLVPVGFVDDEDLRRIVGHADVFVFPSLVEGFGMPPVEAMALGVPTIVSNIEPMSWVAGDGALQFAPTDVGALAELLRRVLDDPGVSEQLARDGRARAEDFDWDHTCGATLAVYDELIRDAARS